MSEEEDFAELADLLKISRHLPYTLTIEKIEGDIIYTHTPWGNNIQYRREGDDFALIDKEQFE